MIGRVPIVDTWSNLRLNQKSLHKVSLDHQADKFKIDNAMVYQILSKVFTDKVTYVYVKERKAMQDGWAVSIFSTLTMWPGRLQKQKECCKTPTMMAREKCGTETSMLSSTKTSMPSWRALQIMATVVWTMTQKLLIRILNMQSVSEYKHST